TEIESDIQYQYFRWIRVAFLTLPSPSRQTRLKIVFNLCAEPGELVMMRTRVLAACATALLMGATAARADEDALRRRIEELETQQRQVLEQLKEMKRELD